MSVRQSLRASLHGSSHFGPFTLRLLLCAAALVLTGTARAQPVVGLEIWYVDEPGRMIYNVNHNVGTVLLSFPVRPQVGTPAGLAVSGTPGGGTSLWLLDSAAGQIYRLDSVTGAVLNVIPAPSANSIGIGAACIVPQNLEELFVVANDGDPGALYWIAPATGAIINRCVLGVTGIRDATAFAQGDNATGVCFLRDINPGGTEIRCVNKLSCQLIWSRTYPWEGWGLGNRTEGTVQGTNTVLYASDLGANIIHVLTAVDGTEIGSFGTVISGANVRGVGGDSTCPVETEKRDRMQQYYNAPSWTSAAAGTTVLHSQNFDASPTACAASGWVGVDLLGYGNYMNLFPGATQVQQDPSVKDLSCLWAAIQGSTEFYACGGWPAQRVVPYGNVQGQYIRNEIWSPYIALAGSAGSGVTLRFSVYRDLALDALVFYTWHVRDTSNIFGAPGPWKDRGLVYYGGQKDWVVHTESVGDLIRLDTATHVQIALGVRDMCGAWCGIYGTGACHSHSPLIDAVKLYRINSFGPQWSIRDIDQFQDNFAEVSGPGAGWVRADAALDTQPITSPAIQPGDSAVVRVADPEAGLADDGSGGKKVYIYVATWPRGQAGKSGAALTQDAARFPWVGTQVVGGITWDCVRLDSTEAPDRYCIDLNDCLFEPGDTICFFYCAENTYGVRTYAFCSNLTAQGVDINQAASDPAEFTCLPAGGWNRGGDILYVDGMDGRGAQTYFDTAFRSLGIFEYVDRYDVRGPTSRVGNRLAGRVADVVQLTDCYRKILWDCGDIEITLGDGSGAIEKTDDFGLLNSFLGNLSNPGGVYLCGDDLPGQLASGVGSSAITFKSTYIPYTLSNPNGGDHVKKGYGNSPLARGIAGRCFSGDTFFISGGSPMLNDFDVMAPAGASVMEVSYGVPGANNGAVISKATNNGATNVGVLLSGFSFIYIRDDDLDGVLDRANHLYDILTWLGNAVNQPTGTTPELHSSLDQNYPNPFNPTTTISFFVKQDSEIRLDIFDVGGALVRALVNEHRKTGAHRVAWDGKNNGGQNAATGVYFYRLTAADFTSTRKMVLLK